MTMSMSQSKDPLRRKRERLYPDFAASGDEELAADSTFLACRAPETCFLFWSGECMPIGRSEKLSVRYVITYYISAMCTGWFVLCFFALYLFAFEETSIDPPHHHELLGLVGLCHKT